MTVLNSYMSFPVTVPVGGSVTMDVSGSFVGCLSSSDASFPLSVDGGSAQFMQAGLTFFTEDGERFRSVTVENPAGEGSPLTVRLMVGTGDIRDSRLSSQGLLIRRADALDTNAVIVLAPAASILAVSPGQFHMNHFFKASPLNLQEMRLGTSMTPSAAYWPLFPGEELTLRVKTPVLIYANNPGIASATLYTLAELAGTPDAGIGE